MLDREIQLSIQAPLESPAAAQLRKGFPWLRFEESLEEEFRETYRAQSRSAVQLNLWLALGLVVAFSAMGHFMVPHGPNRLIDLFRFAVFLPLVGITLLVAYSPLYQRWFSLAVQVLAPTFGINLVILELLAADLEVSFLPGLVLAVICIYFLVGLLFYASVRSGILVLLAYVVGAWLTGLPAAEAAYSTLVLAFANLIGATVSHTLERVNRTNYLEARLLKEMASRDGLTGIYNRRMLDEHLDKVWQQGTRERTPVALLLVDIDYFKAYNDYYGHQAGDESLRHVAHTLARCARRPLDFTARYGGEEFAIVLYNARRDYVEEIARRIRESVEQLALRHPASPVAKQLTVSIGAACIVPVADRSHFGFVQLADEALYEAKGQGRNRLIVMDKEYEQMSTGSFRKGVQDLQATGTGRGI